MCFSRSTVGLTPFHFVVGFQVSVNMLSELAQWGIVWQGIQDANRQCRDVQLSATDMNVVRKRMGGLVCSASTAPVQSKADLGLKTSFADAREMRNKLEGWITALVTDIEKKLEDAPESSVPVVKNCDANMIPKGNFTSSGGCKSDSNQICAGYNNPVTGSCTRVDRNSDGDYAGAAITGRQIDPNKAMSKPANEDLGESDDCTCSGECAKAAANAQNQDVDGTQSKAVSQQRAANMASWLSGAHSKEETLKKRRPSTQGATQRECILSGVGKCEFDATSIGWNAPDGQLSVLDSANARKQSAVMMGLLPSLTEFAASHKDVSWTYGGFQDNGMYSKPQF